MAGVLAAIASNTLKCPESTVEYKIRRHRAQALGFIGTIHGQLEHPIKTPSPDKPYQRINGFQSLFISQFSCKASVLSQVT